MIGIIGLRDYQDEGRVREDPLSVSQADFRQRTSVVRLLQEGGSLAFQDAFDGFQMEGGLLAGRFILLTRVTAHLIREYV